MAWPRSPPAAELHSVTVVLVTGERIQVAGRRAPRDAGQPGPIPGITGTITQVIDNGVIVTPTPQRRPGAPVPTAPAAPGTPTPTSTPTPDGNEQPGAPNRTQGGPRRQFHART